MGESGASCRGEAGVDAFLTHLYNKIVFDVSSILTHSMRLSTVPHFKSHCTSEAHPTPRRNEILKRRQLRPRELDGEEIVSMASIGIAVFSLQGNTPHADSTA